MTFDEILLKLPKPYYRDDAVAIYHADCRDILPLIPDKSIDLVLTDPPYNVGKDYGTYKDNLKKSEYWALASSLIQEIARLAGGNLAFVLGSYGDILRGWWNLSPEAKLIIVKMGAISRNCAKNLFLQYHCVITTVPSNIKKPDLWEDIRWPGEGYFFNEPRFGHPAMTPESLARRLASYFTPSDGITLDPFLGVGTMAVGAKIVNRKCIGIEISEKYCEVAAQRCSQSVMRLETESVKSEPVLKMEG